MYSTDFFLISAQRSLKLPLPPSTHDSSTFEPPNNDTPGMAGDGMPPLATLEKPEKYQKLLREDRGDDCLSCRVVGKGLALSLLCGRAPILTD